MAKYDCKHCGKHIGKECICNIDEFLKIGDVSACQFLDNHVKYGEKYGSPFFQGWGYKHQQLKYERHLKNTEIDQLELKLSKGNEILKESCQELRYLENFFCNDHLDAVKARLFLIKADLFLTSNK